MDSQNKPLPVNRAPIVVTLLVTALAGLLLIVATLAGSARADTTADDRLYLPLVQKSGLPPEITSFTAAADTIAAGDSVLLSWMVTNPFETLTLTPGVGDVTAQTSALVTPTETTLFQLTAVSPAGSDTEAVTVTVVAPPQILSFTADPPTAAPNTAVTLNWSIENEVDSLIITPDVGDVTGQDSIVVQPTETTTYTLTVTNFAGSDVAEETVVITDSPPAAPTITSFSANPSAINQGESSTLSWTITGVVDSLTLNPGSIDVTGQSSIQVSPNSDTTYTLEATNAGGSDSAQTNVDVTQPPNITSFTASPSTINQGGSSTLSWTVSGEVTSLSINQSVGDVTGQSSKSVSPGSTTTYRLTATNGAGSDTATVKVTVQTSGSGPGEEIIVYDWNKPVTTAERGFPGFKPPLVNGNWTSPVDFANGTLYFRVEIFDQPVAQQMKLQLCFWQDTTTREECARMENVYGSSGNVVTWQEDMNDMWEKPGEPPINWAQPRFRVSVAVKNSQGKPVSNFSGWDWNGENPNHWYPLDMRFTAVLVEAGKTFSGWDTYFP